MPAALSDEDIHILSQPMWPRSVSLRQRWSGLLYWWTRIMSQTNGARRNRAIHKVITAQHIAPEIKLAVQVVLGLLNHKSGYCVAWPSAATIAKQLKNGRRTGQWYVRIIRALGIFTCRWVNKLSRTITALRQASCNTPKIDFLADVRV